MAIRTSKATFTGAEGATLAARLDQPEGAAAAYALFAHCFTCSKDIFAASRIASGLAEQGIAVLRFDFTGLGSSEGEFANTNFSSNVEDLVAAADFLRSNYRAPEIIIGHSLGGAAVLAAVARIPELAAVATVNAPFDPSHVGHLIAEAVPEIEAKGEAVATIAGRRFTIKKHFLDDIKEQNARAAIGNLKKALLIFHAPRDQTVAIENAGLIFEAAKHPKSFVSLDDADHLLSRREDSIYVANVLAAWASRYLDGAQQEADADAGGAPAAAAQAGDARFAVSVAETGEGKFTQTVTVGRHTLPADEPVSYGGNDTGPSPYDFLLAGLGTCTAMTLRMYAERKGWTVGKIEVGLNHGRIHAEDCAECETKEGMIDRIERVIEIGGDLDQEQRAKLLEIADKCPVHRTLMSEKVIATRLAD